MPVVGQISVGDGATFTPSVSNSGVISWSNDKNLPNPASVDIAGVVQTAISGVYLPTAGGTVTGNLTVNGTITGNLSGNATTATTAITATNATTAASATNDGNGNEITATYLPLAGGTLTGNLTENSDLIVNGNAALNTISATGNATVGGALGVTGATTLASVNVTGNADVANITASGDITANDVTLSGALSVAGITTLTDDVSVGADLNVTGNITAGADVTVTGDISANDITADDVTTNGNLSVVGNATLSGVSTAVTPAEDDNSTNIATTAYVQTEIKPIEADVSVNDKRISNIEKLLQGNLYDYQTDSSSAYTKTVLNGAMPYASLDSIGGKTVVFNQLVKIPATDISKTENGITFTDNRDGSFTVSGTATADVTLSLPNLATVLSYHKYIVRGCPSGGSASTYFYSILSTMVDSGNGLLYDRGSLGLNSAYPKFTVKSGTVISTPIVWKPQYVDLTLMYGAGNEPTTVQEFTAQLPASYYPYSQGQLLSAGVTEVKSVGKNLCNVNDYHNISSQTVLGSVDLSSGTYTMSATVKNNTSISGYLSLRLGSTAKVTITIANGDSNVRKTATVTLTESATYTVVGSGASAGYSFDITKIQIEKGSTATEYVPYANPLATYPIPAEIQALEGYGWSAGSVYNYIDYERKVFVQRVASVDLGTLTYQAVNYTPYYFQAILNDKKDGLAGLVCSKYVVYGSGVASIQGSAGIAQSTSNVKAVYFVDSAHDGETGATFKTAMDGVYLYYELATPVEVDISAYLTDDNLIEVEAGGTLTFPNANGDDYRIPVPSEETYMVDLQASLGG